MERSRTPNTGRDTMMQQAKVPLWAMVGFVFVILSSPVWLPNLLPLSFVYDPFAGAETSDDWEWRQDLLGKQVNLPSNDHQGYKIPKDRNLFVLSIRCSPCGNKQAFVEELKKVKLHPVVIVIPNEYRNAPDLYKKKPDFILILCDWKGKYVPREMLDFAPQIALVSPEGKIIGVPKKNESADEFFQRGKP